MTYNVFSGTLNPTQSISTVSRILALIIGNPKRSHDPAHSLFVGGLSCIR